jgi:hypothetical protein
MLAVLVLVARRPWCVPGELDSVGVGVMRAPAARQQPAALGRATGRPWPWPLSHGEAADATLWGRRAETSSLSRAGCLSRELGASDMHQRGPLWASRSRCDAISISIPPLPSPYPLSFRRRAACACACSSLPSQPSVAGESPRCRIARVATTTSLLAMSRGFSVHSHLARGQSRTMARSFAHLTCRPLHEASTRPSQGINGHFLQLRLAPSWPMSFLSFLRQQSMVPSPNVDVDIRRPHWRPLSRVQANFLSALDPTGSSRPGCLRRMLAVAHCHYLRR